MDVALRALNRFGLGARPGQRASLGEPRAWLMGQLGDPAAATLPSDGLPTVREASDAQRAIRDAQRSGDQAAVQRARRTFQGILQRESAAAMSRRVQTETPFLERLVAFWSNHLCVSVAAKQPVVTLAGLYEREVVRPHVLGRFEDMVLASARHPAMLFYLDNLQSVGPGAPALRRARARRGRTRGLNENYARELLELHTLGVDGGYGQEDVEALARVLTGWTLTGLGPLSGGRDADLSFVFRAALHEPGTKTVLGRSYAQGGEREGERVIRDLCRHPATATFVAGKLVRHFVADDPPAAAVRRVADVFSATGGDLRAVSAALVELDEAWTPESRKLRTPQDWVVAALRAAGARTYPPRLVPVLRELRHPLWAPPAPKGFEDTVAAWADPDGLMNRAELARTVARGLTRGGRSPEPSRFLDTIEVPASDPLHAMIADDGIEAEERIALAIGGPAFQWR